MPRFLGLTHFGGTHDCRGHLHDALRRIGSVQNSARRTAAVCTESYDAVDIICRCDAGGNHDADGRINAADLRND